MKLLRMLECVEDMVTAHGTKAVEDLARILEGAPFGKLEDFPYHDDLRHVRDMLVSVLKGFGTSSDGLKADDIEMANDAMAVIEKINRYLEEDYGQPGATLGTDRPQG